MKNDQNVCGSCRDEKTNDGKPTNCVSINFGQINCVNMDCGNLINASDKCNNTVCSTCATNKTDCTFLSGKFSGFPSPNTDMSLNLISLASDKKSNDIENTCSGKLTNSGELSSHGKLTDIGNLIDSEKFTGSGNLANSGKFVDSANLTNSEKISDSGKLADSRNLIDSKKLADSWKLTDGEKNKESGKFRKDLEISEAKYSQNNARVDTSINYSVADPDLFSSELVHRTFEELKKDKSLCDNIPVIPNPFEFESTNKINWPEWDGVFADENTPYNSSSNSKSDEVVSIVDKKKEFRWSIDQIAKLLPADIEYKIQEDSLTIFRATDEVKQHKINEYFNNVVLPSPFTPDIQEQNPYSLSLQSSGNDDAFQFHSPIEECLRRNSFCNKQSSFNDCEKENKYLEKKYIDFGCQTDLSCFSIIDGAKFLAELTSSSNDKNKIFNSTKLNYHNSFLPNRTAETSKDNIEFQKFHISQNSTINEIIDQIQQMNLNKNSSDSKTNLNKNSLESKTNLNKNSIESKTNLNKNSLESKTNFKESKTNLSKSGKGHVTFKDTETDTLINSKDVGSINSSDIDCMLTPLKLSSISFKNVPASPFSHFDKLEECFNNMDTSPIRPLYCLKDDSGTKSGDDTEKKKELRLGFKHLDQYDTSIQDNFTVGSVAIDSHTKNKVVNKNPDK